MEGKMIDIMSAYGLNMNNLDAFGFNAERAQEAFSENAVVEFVQGVFDNALPATLAWDGQDYFNFARQADEVINNLPAGTVNFSYVDYMNTINQQMVSSTGHGLSDLHVSIDGAGNITGTVDGVGSGTVNILDAINTALSEAAHNPAFQDALNNLNSTLGGTLGTDLNGLLSGLLTGDLGSFDPSTLGSTGGTSGIDLTGITGGFDFSGIDALA
jgi:hypothetical protein